MISTQDIIKEFKQMDSVPKLIGKKDNENNWYIFDIDEFDCEDIDSIDVINGIEVKSHEFQLFDGCSISLFKDFLHKTDLTEEKLNKINSCLAVQLFEFVEKLWGYASFKS